jgi:hypothetical protein
MANVTPGYIFTNSADPITHTKLNLIGQPTVTVNTGEIGTAQLAQNITVSGLTIATGTPLNGSYNTETFNPFGATSVSLVFSTAKSNTRRLTCSSSTASTISTTAVPAAGYICNLSFATDTTGGNVITFGTGFKATGTYTLTGASKYFQIGFVSDGTNLCELFRSGAAG